MAYLLISILHQSVHQLNDLVRVDRVSTSRIGLREHGPILAASYNGANCGIKLLLVLEDGRVLSQPELISFALGFQLPKAPFASVHPVAFRRSSPLFFFL